MPQRKDGVSCTAKAKSTGVRCGNAPIPGGNVCRIHGGAAPQVRTASARRVLEALVGPALYHLRAVLEDTETPPNVRLAAAKDILDRMGYRSPERIEVITIGLVEAEIARLEAEQAAL